MRIEFSPAVEDPNCPTCPLLGWIRVWMNTVLKPVAEAQVDGLVLNTMFNGAGYVGFTAGTSDTRHQDVNIKNFKLTLVPATASQSALVAQPQPIKAGDVGTVKLQLRVSPSCSFASSDPLSSSCRMLAPTRSSTVARPRTLLPRSLWLSAPAFLSSPP
jgi:hypothetical protein